MPELAVGEAAEAVPLPEAEDKDELEDDEEELGGGPPIYPSEAGIVEFPEVEADEAEEPEEPEADTGEAAAAVVAEEPVVDADVFVPVFVIPVAVAAVVP